MGLLYTGLKIFHFKDKIDSLPRNIDKIMPPVHIRIKPTNVCNHNCYYCAYRAENLQLGKDMVKNDFIPKEKMMEIIEDIIEIGVKAVTFSGGGDPFCYPYLAETVKKLTMSPVKFASLTNGSKVEGEIAEIFAYNATWLRISIDGWDNKSYSSYRKVSNEEFTKVMNNIKQFKKLEGKCYLGISLIVDKNNVTQIYDFIKRLKDTGVDSVKVSPCIVSNNGNENNEYHKPFYCEAKGLINKAKNDFEDDGFEIFDSYHELDTKFKKDYTWCPFLQILPVIGADSNIYSCQDKAYNVDAGLLGSISDQRFKNFWFSDKNNFFKINPSRDCDHHCIANRKNVLVLEYLNADKEHLSYV